MYKDNHGRSRADVRRSNIKAYAKKFGVTVEQFEKLQAGPCELCEAIESGGKANRFHVDHKHGTNVVRGSLCASCNIMVGQIEKAYNSKLLDKAIEYINRFV